MKMSYRYLQRIIYNFEPHIHEHIGSMNEFYTHCFILDYYSLKMPDGEGFSDFIYIIYQFNAEMQILMVPLRDVECRGNHECFKQTLHDELFKNNHKKRLMFVHDDLLANFWSYENHRLWENQIQSFGPVWEIAQLSDATGDLREAAKQLRDANYKDC